MDERYFEFNPFQLGSNELFFIFSFLPNKKSVCYFFWGIHSHKILFMIFTEININPFFCVCHCICYIVLIQFYDITLVKTTKDCCFYRNFTPNPTNVNKNQCKYFNCKASCGVFCSELIQCQVSSSCSLFKSSNDIF